MTIRELRKEKKLSQAEFAKSIGAGLSTITAYEAGKRGPSAKVLAKIREVYGVDLGAPAPAESIAEKAAPSSPKAAKTGKNPAAKKASAGKAPRKPRAGKKAAAPQIIIQSPLGGEITPFAILAKVGEVDKVYIRVDKNKAYWVKGSETGSVDLW